MDDCKVTILSVGKLATRPCLNKSYVSASSYKGTCPVLDRLLEHSLLQIVHPGQVKQHCSERKGCALAKHFLKVLVRFVAYAASEVYSFPQIVQSKA